MVGRGRKDFRLCRPAAFLKLSVDPAAGDNQPGALWRALCGSAQPIKRFLECARAEPVHLGGVGETRANGVDV